MATYHLSIKNGRKGTAAEHAAYIAREGKHGNGERGDDLRASGHGNLPEWANDDPFAVWKAADKHERANGAAYREFEAALPTELTLEQNQQLVHEFINKHAQGKPYQYAIHEPEAALGGVAQPHAHIMVSDRLPDGIARSIEQHYKRFNPKRPEIGGCKKDSGGKSRSEMKEKVVTLRQGWAELQNAALEQHGHSVKVDHRSNKDRGVEKAPEKHLGHAKIRKMSEDEKCKLRPERSAKEKCNETQPAISQ